MILDSFTGALSRRKSRESFDAGEIKRKGVVYTPVLIGIFVCFLVLGLVNLYSASSGSPIFFTQLRHTCVAILTFGACAIFATPRRLNSYAYVIFAGTCLLLLAVLILGKIGGGSQRWIVIGPFRMQPSEIAKISTAIITARFFFASRLTAAYRLRDLWPLAAMVGLISGLIFPEPDFGTAGFIVIIALCQLAFIRLDWRSVGMVIGSGIAIAPIVWNFLLQDYQKFRVLSFLNPELDPQGKGYNALQSLVAIGSGGLSGKGYLQGTQTQLQFLPMRHTDFVFSVFAEEHGFWGCLILFFLFASIAYIAFEIARQAKDTFSSLLAIGIAAFLFIEFTINVAMVLRMFPVVGLPLPFFSYGGSTLMAASIAMGILVAIDRDSSRKSQNIDPVSTYY